MADDRSDLWLSRPDVWSGAVLGGLLATRSFAPSLMPRRTQHQALVSGVAAAAGFGLGGAVYGTAARTGSTRGDLAVLGGLGAVGFGVSRGLAERHHEPLWRSSVRAVGEALAAGSAAAAGGVVVRGSRERFVAGSALALVAAAVGGREVARGLRAQRDALEDTDPPPPRPLPALGSSLGVASVVAAVANGYRHSGRALANVFQRRLGIRAFPSEVAGDLVAIGLWVGTAKALSDVFVGGVRLYDRVVDPGYDQAPDAPTRSSGPGSPLSFARLGREGRRFVVDAPTAAQITEVMGAPAVAEPVRVYVGYAHGRDDDTRIALAIDELRRTGGFDRSLLVVGCPAGNGLVNTLPLEVLDHVLGGDVAAVAVPYGRLPSFLTINRVTRGGRVHRRLLEAIAAELATRPPERRPRVVVYGESLGAWAGQDAFLHQGVAGLDGLGVERALWVGTPYYSGWRDEVLDGATATDDGTVVEVGDLDGLAALGLDDRDRLRALILGHDNDPVRYISATLLVRRPPWLGRDRPARVPEAMTFLPLLTTVEVLIDAVNATRPEPGRFRATGHEYDGELPEAVLVAYGVDRPDDQTWDRLVRHLEALDAERAATQRALPEPSAELPGPGVDDRPRRRWPREGSGTRPRRPRPGAPESPAGAEAPPAAEAPERAGGARSHAGRRRRRLRGRR